MPCSLESPLRRQIRSASAVLLQREIPEYINEVVRWLSCLLRVAGFYGNIGGEVLTNYNVNRQKIDENRGFTNDFRMIQSSCNKA